MTNNAVSAAVAGGRNLASLKKAVAKTHLPPAAGGLDFLRLRKDGRWVYGANNTLVEEGSKWAVDPFSFKFGYVCWTDYPARLKKRNDKLDTRTVPLGADPIDPSSLPDYMPEDESWNNGEPWEWREYMEVKLRCITGEDTGKEVLYATNSYGGLGCLRDYVDRLNAALESDTPVAVVRLSSDSYEHGQYGMIYTPEFDYVDFLTLDATDVPAGDAEDESDAAYANDAGAEALEASEPPRRGRRRPAA